MPPFDPQPDNGAEDALPPLRPRWRGTVIGLLCGFAIGAGAVLVVPPLLEPLDLLRYYGVAMAGGAALAILAWGLWWLLRMHRRSRSANVIVCAGLVISALVIVDIAHDQQRARLRSDLAAMHSIRVGLNGVPVVAPGMTPGPITREALSFFADGARQGRTMTEIFRNNGYNLYDPVLLARDPAPLADCARAERSAPAVDAIDQAWFARLDRFRAYLSGAIGDATWRTQALNQLDGYGPRPEQRATWRRLRHDLLTGTSDYCRLLTRRNWQVTGTSWRFTDPADRAAGVRLRDAIARTYAAQTALVPIVNYARATPTVRATPAPR